jgi:hypothetical protein
MRSVLALALLVGLAGCAYDQGYPAGETATNTYGHGYYTADRGYKPYQEYGYAGPQYATVAPYGTENCGTPYHWRACSW